MSSHMALPREGHLKLVLQIFAYVSKYHNAKLVYFFAYVSKYHNAKLVYDLSDPDLDLDTFERKDWTSSEFGHVDGKEELPLNAPPPRGLGLEDSLLQLHGLLSSRHANPCNLQNVLFAFCLFGLDFQKHF